ncbi:hypothetical protein K493DRAFT_311107 [Basidiobolus meristosporus CBS 931.73]|uniref:DNA-directed RNA polymerase I, subunit RPA34.5 n=1 Tax=Basidiobolus meristosporus CBS 931.73 TaxID=1314790 RepID=A0A1Y1WTQ5_9FUNG|nr:hypothetical protein K493DRAFT_321482 [Basidiobolus meristosporus CBS 931.73]ORY05113.1 hypothetical protein K493DRAFT_311107 [Basidiobolus meristosporus CBS 931.73]|eukprot:ORX76930.1 hypothetical protein K493DRAFT_321482 [Basidiobolus meristosporus CBS 931.73]
MEYQPPEDFALAKFTQETPFQLSEIGDDKELWLIRVPLDISAEQLNGLKIKLPEGKEKKIGSLKAAAEREYELFEVLEDNEKSNSRGGQEMDAMYCLLPNGAKGSKYTSAPTKFARKLNLVQKVDIPDSTEVATTIRDREYVPRAHPEGLKMRFKPYGFDTGEKREIAEVESTPSTPQKSKKPKKEKSAKKKSKHQ